MSWQEFTALLVLATAMTFTPGPNTALSTTLAANHGLKRTLPFVCSVAAGWGVLLVLCALGLGTLLLAVPALGRAINMVGATYLLWLAWKLFGTTALGQANSAHLRVSFWQGAALQFVNVKAWMLALSIVSGWVAGQAHPLQRFGVVLPLMLAFALSSNLTYALAGSLLRQWLAGPGQSGRRLMAFNRLMALALAGTAVWILVR